MIELYLGLFFSVKIYDPNYLYAWHALMFIHAKEVFFSQELEEEYETDPSENIITFFRLSFPQRDPFSTTTEQPIEIEGSDQPQLFTIIRFTYNPDTQDYDSAESQSDYGIRGSFDEDKERVFIFY